MKTAAALVAGVATAALTLLPAAPAFATGHRIQIHEIYYNSPGSDTGANSSLNAEWVQLYNTSASKITLTHWTLRDKAGHVFTFGTYTIGAHSHVKVHTGHGTSNQTDRYWNKSWYIWNNTGDTAMLRDSSGGTVDSCTYKGTTAGWVTC